MAIARREFLGAMPIIINVGPNDIVNLRGLTLDGAGTLQFGILLNSASSVTITDCFIRHFNGNGIELNNADLLQRVESGDWAWPLIDAAIECR